jgi:hypothetical protein
MQLNASENLEFGCSMALRLKGYQFKYMTVKFNRSTIQDDLKFQQAQEINIRNIKDKLVLGLINQDTAADEAGYDTPAFPKPHVDWEVVAGQSPQVEADAAVKDGKKKSAKKVRDKNKPTPKDYKK